MTTGIFAEWTPDKAQLLSTDVRTTTFAEVDIKTAASEAVEQLNIENPDGHGYIVPLFAKDEPVPTDEYVIYRPENDHIGWFDAGLGAEGTTRFTDAARLADKEVGHRLRFWLPSIDVEPEVKISESDLPDDEVAPHTTLTTDQREQFFSDLIQFVRSEREADREASWKQYRETGLKSAIRQNRMSGPFLLMNTSTDSNGLPIYQYQFLIDEDQEEHDVDLRGDESLFQGNECVIDASRIDELPIAVEVLSVDDPQITIKPRWDQIADRGSIKTALEDGDTEIWLYDLLNPVPYERRLSALRAVESTQRKRDLLTGDRPVKYTVNKYDLPEAEIELNEYQQTALAWAVCANDVVCIHGPPGTGKTRTLTGYVQCAVSQQQSVLVTAHSNQAVDNLLVGDSTPDSPEEGTLHAMAQNDDYNMSIARVGSNSRSLVVNNQYSNQSTSQADVVAATTSGAAQFDQNEFDIAVVDEATQASRPATAIALNAANKLVLAGDHKQLPPYSADEDMQDEEMHISLFEYLLDRYDEQISVLLEKQYRMNEQIAEFPNQTFYNAELKTANQNQNWSAGDLGPLVGIDIDGRERQRSQGYSYYNSDEADVVTRQVQLLVRAGLDPEDIGIISAYSGQIGEIGTQVNQLDHRGTHKIDIDTIDAFQGGEREAIIVSFVRSNQDGHSGFLAFPEEGPRRLNVALTRARRRLVLVGDWETLGTIAPHRSRNESCAPLYAELAKHIQSEGEMIHPNK